MTTTEAKKYNSNFVTRFLDNVEKKVENDEVIDKESMDMAIAFLNRKIEVLENTKMRKLAAEKKRLQKENERLSKELGEDVTEEVNEEVTEEVNEVVNEEVCG
jgi:regulator of replication initiation timing